MQEYSEFIVHPETLANAFEGASGTGVRTWDANFSEHFGFERLGIHHVILPAASRTSHPHAESLEEEFIFVVSGRPHVWIDGYVYQVHANCAVGFPAGTGIAHTVINNSDEPVHLIVVGESTKKENRCSFPVNPDQAEKCQILWTDAPVRPLGPHNGRPGAVKPGELGRERPSCIVDCAKLPLSKGWHYPGDSETFGEYARLTDVLGLQALGIGFETLAPGRRSAFPHAHKREEEFAFILSGTATVWHNGFVYEAGVGKAVGFPPGSNIAHVLINNTDQPMSYLMIGEAKDVLKQDRLIYPMHPFRNDQCRKKNTLWTDRPVGVAFGPHDGRPSAGLADHLALRLYTEADEASVLSLFLRSPTYFKRVDGCVATLASVRQAATDGPKKSSETYVKEFLIVEYDDEAVGVVDLHLNHPEAGMAYVGLLLLTEERFGKGLGRRVYALVENYAMTTFAVKTLRLGISDENDVSGFWQKVGFLPNGRTYSWQGEKKTANLREFEKRIGE